MSPLSTKPPVEDDSTWLLPPSSDGRRRLEITVRVSGATAQPSSLRLTPEGCVIGSAPGCSITVTHLTVSRKHVELRLVPEGVLVRDLGSTNGTYYLGGRIQELILPWGGVLSLGKVTVNVEPDGDAGAGVLEFNGSEYRGIRGVSPSMRRLFALLVRLEGSRVPVLIQGESGVGKELIASALHEGSPFAGKPLVVVNCGAIPRELIASELFGHKKGAFTGALESRTGAFESADGGTLFLDEIGELPLDMQPMLLRALESGEVRPVGSDQVRRVKVRVIAATNRDLRLEVKEKRFREDLLYRLAVVHLSVPPLRERREDVELLANKFAQAAGIDDLPEDVIDKLRSRHWPGNVRELRNVVQAYAALGIMLDQHQPKDVLLEVTLGQVVDLNKPYLDQKDALSEAFTRIYLAALLEHTRGNKSAAARISGLDRTYMGRLLSKYGLAKD